MKYFVLIATIAFLAACSTQQNPDERLKDKEVPADFDIGEMKEGVFTNKYFGFKFRFNEDWDIQTEEELAELVDLGSEIASGGDNKMKSALKASQVRSAQHFCAFKYDVGSSVDFNPSIMVISENIKGKNLVYGDEYLEIIREMWPKTQVNVKQIGVIKELEIGGEDFFVMEAETKAYGISIRQKYYCSIRKDFALCLIVSYLDEEQENEMSSVIDSFGFR